MVFQRLTKALNRVFRYFDLDTFEIEMIAMRDAYFKTVGIYFHNWAIFWSLLVIRRGQHITSARYRLEWFLHTFLKAGINASANFFESGLTLRGVPAYLLRHCTLTTLLTDSTFLLNVTNRLVQTRKARVMIHIAATRDTYGKYKIDDRRSFRTMNNITITLPTLLAIIH